MNDPEARELLDKEIERLRKQSYSELCSLIDREETIEIIGESRTRYQVQIQAFWDDRAGNNLRVRLAIDDGGWRAFMPLLEDFIIAPDGTFVGE